MKIEFENGDLDYIERVNTDIINCTNDIPLLIKKGKTYYINFTCKDAAKANAVILELMNSSYNGLEETTGMQINSLNLCNGDEKVGELKDLLKSFMERLDTL